LFWARSRLEEKRSVAPAPEQAPVEEMKQQVFEALNPYFFGALAY
jgi:hypothetical protein